MNGAFHVRIESDKIVLDVSTADDETSRSYVFTLPMAERMQKTLTEAIELAKKGANFYKH